jgi:outer membrane protein assembly factor BamB
MLCVMSRLRPGLWPLRLVRRWWRESGAVALIVLLPATGAAQRVPRPFPSPSSGPAAEKKADRTPPAFFPIRTLWTLELNNQLTAPPAFDAERMYFAIEHNRLLAYDLRSGTQQWMVEANPQMEPAVGEGLLFLIEAESLVARHVGDGSIAWELPFADVLVAPPVYDNGWLIAATAGRELLAFRATDGHLIWRHPLGAVAHARPTLAADRVYVPTDDGRVVALRVDTGAPVWERTIGGAAAEILVLEDRLYVGSKNNYLYCLKTADGTVDWKWRTGADIIGVPVSGDHEIYFVALDNVLRALHRKTGAQLWKAGLPMRPTTAPVKAGQTLIVTGAAPPLHAYGTADGKPAGELTAAGEIAAPPHLFLPEHALVPSVISIVRDIAKGATVSVVTRDFEPAIVPIAPLPNLIPMNPADAIVKP